MTNKKFKIAAMSLALTACVAASPLAANAETPDNTVDPPPTAVDPADTQEAPEEELTAVEEAPVEEPAAEQEPEAPVAEEEAPEQEAEAASEKEEAAQPAADVAVLPAVAAETPVVVETPAEEAPAEETPAEEAPEEEAPAEETPTEETPEEEAPAEETPAEAETPAEEPEEPEAPAQSAEEKEPEEQEPAADSDSAAPAEDITPAVSPLLPGADNAVSSDAQISLLLPPEEGAVALVDNTVATVINEKGEITGSYDSFDEAVSKAEDGATIRVTKDATSEGLNLSKNLTIQGDAQTVTEKDADGNDVKTTVKPKLTLNKGIGLWGSSLTFKDMQVIMDGVGSTPYAEWTWMAVCSSGGSTLTLDNTDMTMDGTGTASNTHCIYFCGNDKLNVQNGSNLTIKNYKQDAMEWDGGDGGYNINITGGSTVTSDHNRSGFTGTFFVTVDDSTLNVINSTGNGSNGSHFNIKNGSTVDFSNNHDHGISAGKLTIEDSTVTANNNGLTGITFTQKDSSITNSTVTITGTKGLTNSHKYGYNAGLRLGSSSATLDIKNSTVTVADNYTSGIFCRSGSKLTIDDASTVTVTGNKATQENDATKDDLAQSGGGLVVSKNAQAKLGANTTINNNHAALAGDDIFVEAGGKLTFSVANAGTGDTLNDCGDKIDGWYIDANGQRWNFHGEEPFFQNLLDSGAELTRNDDGTYTITAGEGGLALKAAHAELPAPEPDPDPEPTPDPDTPDTPVSPEDPTTPPAQDATPDEAETPVTPENPTTPVQDATPDSTVAALPKTGVNWFTALAMALSGMALTVAGAFTSLFAKSKH